MNDLNLYHINKGNTKIKNQTISDVPNVNFTENCINIKHEYIPENKYEEKLPTIKYSNHKLNIMEEYTNELSPEGIILYECDDRNISKKNNRNSLEIMLNIKNDIYNVIARDPTYRIPLKMYKDIIDVKNNVITILNNDPKYQYMMENISKTLIFYDFVTLVIAIGTLNPISIIFSLYSLGKRLE